MKLNLLIPPKHFDKIEITKYPEIHCGSDEFFLLPEGFKFEVISTLQKEIDHYRKLSEHRLKGLNYWKKKNEIISSGI